MAADNNRTPTVTRVDASAGSVKYKLKFRNSVVVHWQDIYSLYAAPLVSRKPKSCVGESRGVTRQPHRCKRSRLKPDERRIGDVSSSCLATGDRRRRALMPVYATPTTHFHSLHCSLCIVLSSVVLVTSRRVAHFN